MILFDIFVCAFFTAIIIIIFVLRQKIFTTPSKFGSYTTLSTGKCISGKRLIAKWCQPDPLTGRGCLNEFGNQSFDIILSTEKCAASSTPASTLSLTSTPSTSVSEILSSISTLSSSREFSSGENSLTTFRVASGGEPFGGEPFGGEPFGVGDFSSGEEPSGGEGGEKNSLQTIPIKIPFRPKKGVRGSTFLEEGKWKRRVFSTLGEEETLLLPHTVVKIGGKENTIYLLDGTILTREGPKNYAITTRGSALQNEKEILTLSEVEEIKKRPIEFIEECLPPGDITRKMREMSIEEKNSISSPRIPPPYVRINRSCITPTGEEFSKGVFHLPNFGDVECFLSPVVKRKKVYLSKDGEILTKNLKFQKWKHPSKKLIASEALLLTPTKESFFCEKVEKFLSPSLEFVDERISFCREGYDVVEID